MKILGAHMSIAGGPDLAIRRGAQTGCDAIQMFTKSSNQWRARPLAGDEIDRFRVARLETGIAPVVAHDCYLINLASPDDALYRRSIDSFGEELDRCEALDIPFLVAHPGAHVGAGEDFAIDRIASAVNGLLRSRPGHRVKVLLETTAGQGTSVGHRFEHLRAILDRLESADRAGVCLDTCHVFAAGYDLRTRKSYDAVMAEFDRIVGLEKIQAFHLNDCKKDLGCRVDRHEHLGRGFLGEDAFRWLMRDPRFDGIPMLLETPKGPDGAEDLVNLALLRRLQDAGKGAAAGPRGSRKRTRAGGTRR
ncbi:MAG TPA: deoxyribonuclease IV [Candidatus Polarisedimenticolia bacterium]|nr:deoxyribonuclease IV [Candidatus Polarisedimenticolia bacterium]